MVGRAIRVGLQSGDFDPGAEVNRLREVSKSIGGLVLFLGVARGESGGKKVVQLGFEAYPEMAERELSSLAEEAAERFRLWGITILHRLGVISPGESIVLIAAAGAHREESFAAARWCIDELKKRVPIWKKEVYDDGQVWVEESP